MDYLRSNKNITRIILSCVVIFTLGYSFALWCNNLLDFFVKFTYTGNLFVAISLILISIDKINERFMIYLTAFGTLIFLVFALLLSEGLFNESWTSLILHYIAPLYLIFDFFVLNEEINYSYKGVLSHIILPVVYLIYVLIACSLSSTEWPYFFLDLTNLGFLVFSLYVSGITIFFILISFTLTYLKKRQS